MSSYYQKQEKIDVLILCGRQNIAFGWGLCTPKNKRNYMAVFYHMSKHDEILQSHLNYPVTNSRIKYTSPDIQNDITGINGEMLPEKIVRELHND